MRPAVFAAWLLVPALVPSLPSTASARSHKRPARHRGATSTAPAPASPAAPAPAAPPTAPPGTSTAPGTPAGPAAPASPAVPEGTVVVPPNPPAPTLVVDWARPPGPIAGTFRLSCEASGGMQVSFTVNGRKAVGRITELGAAGKYGYATGQEILQLSADDYGDWWGTLQYRDIRGGQLRPDPIRLVASAEGLDATMTTDECYKKMTRVH